VNAEILKAYKELYLREEVGYPKSGKMFLGRCTFRMLESIREVLQVTIRHPQGSPGLAPSGHGTFNLAQDFFCACPRKPKISNHRHQGFYSRLGSGFG